VPLLDGFGALLGGAGGLELGAKVLRRGVRVDVAGRLHRAMRQQFGDDLDRHPTPARHRRVGVSEGVRREVEVDLPPRPSNEVDSRPTRASRPKWMVDTVTYIVCAGLGLAIDGESFPYIAGWGEHGALEAVNRFAVTIDDLARRIEKAIRPTPERAAGRGRLIAPRCASRAAVAKVPRTRTGSTMSRRIRLATTRGVTRAEGEPFSTRGLCAGCASRQ
jgi:hypothetical protein